MILNNDKVLNTLLEILRDDDGTADPTIAASIMKTFVSLAQKDDAARDRLAKLGVLEEVMDWIQQSGEEAEDGSVGRALQVLGAMALSPKHAKTIHSARVFDQCVDLMTDRKLKPVSFAAGMNLVTNVMKSNDKAAKQIDDSGVAGRLVNMFVINDDMIDDDNESYILRSAYVHDDDTAEAAVNFIFNLAKDKDLKDSLKMQKADGVVMSIMNENPENKEVQSIGAKALSLLLTSADLMMQSHAKIEAIEQKIDNAPRKYIKPLVAELNQLLSGTKMQGAVDSKSADAILKLVNRTLNRMEIHEDKEIVDGVEDARIACYQLAGQLATLQ